MNHDIYVTPQGLKVRVTRHNVLVRPDPLPEMSRSGLIHMPGHAVEDVMNSGEIVAFGHIWTDPEEDEPRRIPVPELFVGMRVTFIRYLGEVHSTKAMQAVIGDEIVKMDITDIVCCSGEASPVECCPRCSDAS